MLFFAQGYWWPRFPLLSFRYFRLRQIFRGRKFLGNIKIPTHARFIPHVRVERLLTLELLDYPHPSISPFLSFSYLFIFFSRLHFPLCLSRFPPLFLCSFEYIFLAVFFFVLSALSPSSCHRTTVQKNQEFRRRHCANCSSFCSFIHTAHSFAFTLCSAALIHLLAR